MRLVDTRSNTFIMHSFRGFKELHLNLKIVPDLFFHCNFINPLIIFETIFGKNGSDFPHAKHSRVYVCHVLFSRRGRARTPHGNTREKHSRETKKAPNSCVPHLIRGATPQSCWAVSSALHDDSIKTAQHWQELRKLWGNSSKEQYYTQSWEGCFMGLTSFWENISAECLQEEKQSKTKDGGCSQSSRSKRISV